MKSTFMTQVKKGLKNNSKKELIKKVVLGIEMNAQQEMRDGEMINNLQEEIEHVLKDLIDTKKELEEQKLKQEQWFNNWKLQLKELSEVKIELEETQEALRRNRNQLESYKMFEQEIIIWKMLYDNNESFLKSAESAIRMYENMNPYTFFIHKYIK